MTKHDHSPRVRFVDSNASVLFDLIRGVAALLVFTSHARNFFFFDYPLVTAHRALVILPYVLTGAGHQAVVVFFVLSGYFISGSVLQAVERKRWLWKDYLLRRLLRLWVVLLPALLVCILWDTLGTHLGDAPGRYMKDVFTPSTWFGNLFFVQTILVPSFGSDNPLWSLANEFWYYMLFPLGLLAARAATPRGLRVLYAALFLAVAWFVHGDILRSFPIWLAGTLLVVMPPPEFSARTRRRALALATPLYLLFFFAVSRNRRYPMLVGDYVLTVATFGFLWLLLSAKDRAQPKALRVRISRDMARFSYTLYTVHLPLLTFAAAVIVGDGHWQPSLRGAVFASGICCVTLLYAYGIAWLTEFRTDALRRRIELALGLPAPRSPLPSDPAQIDPA